MAQDTLTDREIMQKIMQVLGPRSACECSGCAYEQNEAIRLLQSVGIEYQFHRKRPVPHDPVAERLGNEIVTGPEHAGDDPYYYKDR